MDNVTWGHNQIDVVIFDFDGTLVDSENIKNLALFEVVKKFEGSREIMEEILERNVVGSSFTRNEIFLEFAKKLKCDDDPEHLSSRLVDRYTRLCEERISHAQEIMGAECILENLHQTSKYLFVSSATPEFTLLRLIELRGWAKFFDGVYGAPSSKFDHLRLIARRCNAEPSRMLLIGDLESDLKVAQRSGARFIGIGKDKSFSEYSAPIMSNLAELSGFLSLD